MFRSKIFDVGHSVARLSDSLEIGESAVTLITILMMHMHALAVFEGPEVCGSCSAHFAIHGFVISVGVGDVAPRLWVSRWKTLVGSIFSKEMGHLVKGVRGVGQSHSAVFRFV